MPIFVRKLNGELERFDESKLIRSLLRAGADRDTANEILRETGKFAYDGIETRKLFKFVLTQLKHHKPTLSERYDMKNAIARLGSDGYVFEKFVARIYARKGFSVQLNRVVQGTYVSHEIDVSATYERERIMVECKHHAAQGIILDIKTALYVYARFLDLSKSFTRAMLVTNTRFSDQVVDYSRGVGMGLMGWSYPRGESLADNIERYKLYPITMLRLLGDEGISSCIRREILTVDELLRQPEAELTTILKVDLLKAKRVIAEATMLMSNGNSGQSPF